MDHRITNRTIKGQDMISKLREELETKSPREERTEDEASQHLDEFNGLEVGVSVE